MTDYDELDFSPLIMIDRAHEARHGTIRLLQRLFNDIARVLPDMPRNTQFAGRLYLQRLVIELTCQYVEDVGGYSVACMETGLLYVRRVMSVTSREIGRFYGNVETLTDEHLSKIFHTPPSGEGTKALDFSQVRVKYRTLREFRDKYQGLYNAMKHGSRVLHMEMSTKDKPMNSLVGTYVTYQWVEVKPGSSKKHALRTRDGSEVESKIGDFTMKTELVPADSVDEFVSVAGDCHQIIADILRSHAAGGGKAQS